MIQRSRELEDNITNFVIKEKGHKAAILAAEKEARYITKSEQEKTSKDREDAYQFIQMLHAEISNPRNERDDMASKVSKHLANIRDSHES